MWSKLGASEIFLSDPFSEGLGKDQYYLRGMTSGNGFAQWKLQVALFNRSLMRASGRFRICIFGF